jgi:sec-independent protein translocase protein TatA
MGIPGGIELFIIIAVVVLLFGGKKIPELAKGLGKGIKDFKSALKEDEVTKMDTKIDDETVADIKTTDTKKIV